LPAAIDWRTMGAVTPIKDQGQCGSCWAFSSTGALEAQIYKKTKTLTTLSEQNLVDCNKANFGCNGGWMDYAFDYVKTNKGIDKSSAYPYTGYRGTCKYKSATTYVGGTCTGRKSIPAGNETALQIAVATIGPVSVAIDASGLPFQLYSSGVYKNLACSKTNLDHAVLVVGYGTTNDQDYWIVKNSWGTSWGMSGYILMPRNQKNYCGIATHALYPTV
jgi:cathepsin L